MIRALLALFLVAVAALVVVNRGAMGGSGPVMVAGGAVLFLVVAPLIWEGVMTSRAVRRSVDRSVSIRPPLSRDTQFGSNPPLAVASCPSRRAWTAPRPSIWSQPPQPRDWFAHRSPRIAGWEGGVHAGCAPDPGASLKSI